MSIVAKNKSNVRCPDCGALIRPTFQWCAHCGQSLSLEQDKSVWRILLKHILTPVVLVSVSFTGIFYLGYKYWS